MSAPVSGIAKTERRLRKALSTDEGITRFLTEAVQVLNAALHAYQGKGVEVRHLGGPPAWRNGTLRKRPRPSSRC
jgi:hypothetical protein